MMRNFVNKVGYSGIRNPITYRKSDSLDVYWLYFVGFVLVFIHPMLNSMISARVRTICLLTGIVMLTAVSIFENRGIIKMSWLTIAWTLVGSYALVSHLFCAPVVFNSSVPILLAVVNIIVLSVGTTKWVAPALDALLVMCLVHAVATVYIFLNPNIYYSFIKPVFFANARNATGYQSGLTSHYSVNGQYQATGLIIAASFYFRGKSHRTIWGVISALFVFALLITTKRAHMICSAIAVSSCFLLGNMKGKAFKYVMFIIVTLLALLALASFVPAVGMAFDRLSSTFETSDINEITNGRTVLWAEALKGWRHSPLFGNGWSSFYYLWPSGITTSVLAHNELLQLLDEVGVVGTIFVVILELACVFISYKVAKDVIADSAMRFRDKVSVTFAFSYQLFCLIYGYTSGSLLQASYVFVPYLIAVGIGIAYDEVKCEMEVSGSYPLIQ